MARRLEGKVALITGAASGIGRESAVLFSGEGAAVVVVDRDDKGGRETVDSISDAGGQAVYVHADVSRTDDCARMVAAAEASSATATCCSHRRHQDSRETRCRPTRLWNITMNIMRRVFLG